MRLTPPVEDYSHDGEIRVDPSGEYPPLFYAIFAIPEKVLL